MNEDSTNVSRRNLHDLAQLALSSLTFTPAEDRLFKEVEQGDLIVFTSDDPEKDNPANAGSWGENRTIRAECIEWLCYDKQAQDRIHPRGIQIQGAKISEPLDLNFARVPFPLALAKCAFTDSMLLQYARICALNLQGSHVESISADELKLDFNFFLSDGFRAEGEVRLVGATVGGDLDCSGGQFINKKKKEDDLSRRDALLDELRDLVSCYPDDTTVREQLAKGLVNTINHAKDKEALSADRAQIKGAVFLSDGFRAEGEVRLVGATVGGDLDCSEGQFINNKEEEEDLSRRDALLDELRDLVSCYPDDTTVREQLAKGLVNTTNHAKDKEALSADGVQIKGAVFLSDGFRAEGRVSLVSAIVESWLIWKDVLNPDETTMDLRGAHVDTLCDDPNSWPKSGNLYLHGFCYDEIADDAPVDAKQRIEWLRRQPSEHFFPQPYEHLAAVLSAKGHEKAAKKVRIAKNVDRRRRGTMTPIARLLHWLLLGVVIGYGYRTWRPLLVGLLLVGIGWGLFHGGARAGVIMRVERDEFVPADGAISLVQPRFHPLLYSFDIFLPVISFGHADLWAPNEAIKGPLLNVGCYVIPISGFVLSCYKWGLNVAGWVLTTLFIAGLTGIIRRRV